jgi:hypothetical protein
MDVPADGQRAPGTPAQLAPAVAGISKAISLDLFLAHAVRLAISQPSATEIEVFWGALKKLIEQQIPIPAREDFPDPDLFRAIIAVARRHFPNPADEAILFADHKAIVAEAKHEPLHLEPALLNLILYFASQPEPSGFRPSHERWLEIWRAAWAFRVAQGAPLPTPPDIDLFTNLAELPQSERGKSAQQILEVAHRLLRIFNFYGKPPPAYPLYCDPSLLDAIVYFAVVAPDARADDVYRLALHARSLDTARPSPPFPVPDVSLRRRIVLVARRGTYTAPRDILNTAVAELLDLRIQAPAREIEQPLLEAIVAESLRWSEEAWARDPKGSAWEIWRRALALRGAREDLLWPPFPTPDESLLHTLVYTARNVIGLPPERLLDMALVLLGRATEEEKRPIRQMLEEGSMRIMAEDPPQPPPQQPPPPCEDPQQCGAPPSTCHEGQFCCRVPACKAAALALQVAGGPFLAVGCGLGWIWACQQIWWLEELREFFFCLLGCSDEPPPEPPPPDGSKGRPCLAGGECNAGLACGANNVCDDAPTGPPIPPPGEPPDPGGPGTGGMGPLPGAEGGKCHSDGTCDGILQCIGQKCEAPGGPISPPSGGPPASLRDKPPRQPSSTGSNVSVQLGFAYEHADCLEDFLRGKLWPGHDLAVKQITAAIVAIKLRGPAVDDKLKSYFGRDALSSDNLNTILERFFRLSAAVYQDYVYKCLTNTAIECGEKQQAVTDEFSSKRNIALCTDQLHGYTHEGMAALIIHESIHRIGFFQKTWNAGGVDDPHRRWYRERETTGECRPGQEHNSPTPLLANGDSYACFAQWAYSAGYFDR